MSQRWPVLEGSFSYPDGSFGASLQLRGVGWLTITFLFGGAESFGFKASYLNDGWKSTLTALLAALENPSEGGVALFALEADDRTFDDQVIDLRRIEGMLPEEVRFRVVHLDSDNEAYDYFESGRSVPENAEIVFETVVKLRALASAFARASRVMVQEYGPAALADRWGHSPAEAEMQAILNSCGADLE